MHLLFLTKLDQDAAIEICSNALKALDKNEQATYFKDVAEIIKRELDTQKG